MAEREAMRERLEALMSAPAGVSTEYVDYCLDGLVARELTGADQAQVRWSLMVYWCAVLTLELSWWRRVLFWWGLARESARVRGRQ